MQILLFSVFTFRPRYCPRNKRFPNAGLVHEMTGLKTRGYTIMSFTNILVRMRRWCDVLETTRELNRLDDRELNDLGIGRWRISEIAERSVG